MKSPYYTDPKVKELIDEALHQCAIIFANLGCTDTKEAYDEAREQEQRILTKLMNHDPEIIMRLLND
tara:strand:- start:410 stop:610 length:201 start_codon:yes stop_codon:yes gene_type:complete